MTRSRLLLALPACLLALAACGDDDGGTPVKSTTAVTPVEQGTSPMDPGITAPSVPVTTDGFDDSDSAGGIGATTHSNPKGPAQIDVRVGTDSGPTRVEIVAKGTDVQINIVNPAAADEYHVHGYDLEQKVAAGEQATFNFTADQAGTFEIESHTTEAVVMVLQVT